MAFKTIEVGEEERAAALANIGGHNGNHLVTNTVNDRGLVLLPE